MAILGPSHIPVYALSLYTSDPLGLQCIRVPVDSSATLVQAFSIRFFCSAPFGQGGDQYLMAGRMHCALFGLASSETVSIALCACITAISLHLLPDSVYSLNVRYVSMRQLDTGSQRKVTAN